MPSGLNSIERTVPLVQQNPGCAFGPGIDERSLGGAADRIWLGRRQPILPRTNYRSGQEFHFDWAVGKRFDSGFTVGAFGFWYRQTTADGGRGAQQTGDLKGKAWGIGPIVQYSREIAGIPTTAAFRWQRVPQHRNRVDDDSFMFTVAFSF